MIFPPGRARLATNPFPTGSVSCAITMGIVRVASSAGRVTAAPAEMIRSSLGALIQPLAQAADQVSVGKAPFDHNIPVLPCNPVREGLPSRPGCEPQS